MKAPSQAKIQKLLSHYRAAQYVEAEQLAISITKQYPKHQFGWKVLSAVLKNTNRIADSLLPCQKAAETAPKDAEAHNNLGITLKQLSRLEESEASYRQAIALKPDYAEAQSNLGVTLQELGKLEFAKESLRRAIKLKPDFAQAHYNLGITLQALGRLDEAEASYRTTILIEPSYAEAYNNLGMLLQEQDMLEEAEANYQKAILIAPNYAEVYNNLGVTLIQLGRIEEADSCYSQAIVLKSDFAEAYNNMASALKGRVFTTPNREIQAIITTILDHRNYVRPADISNAAISLLRFEPGIKASWARAVAGNTKTSLGDTISDLSEVPLLLKLMSVSPIADLELETMLTGIRSDLLFSITVVKDESKVLLFQSALALQCFTNEYVYGQNYSESEELEKLEATIRESFLKGKQPNSQSILCMASYKSLNQYEWSDLLAVTDDIKEVFKRQIIEPMQETRSLPNIPILQEITDEVSSKVRGQYEKNPYPRWVNTGLPAISSSLSQVIKKLELSIFDTRIHEMVNPTILIGGCGTGQHSVETAARFKDSSVLAIDLSLASIAYAKRKSAELGVKNLDYMQADILDLGKLNKTFDVIESIGVLHHMKEPMTGWRILTDRLNPKGLMRIGLYSHLARRHIVQIHEEIASLNVDTSDDSMKNFRRKIIGSNEEHHKWISNISDFYSTSELRDLLFHEQEHRFTLRQIQECLSELELRFCGFESGPILQNFKLTNPAKADLYNLDKWIEYEETHTDTFIGMYQFWCQSIV